MSGSGECNGRISDRPRQRMVPDSVNAGKSTTTDGNGNYALTGLTFAGFTRGDIRAGVRDHITRRHPVIGRQTIGGIRRSEG